MPMMNSAAPEKKVMALFDFRVLVRHEPKFEVYAAYCIQTGSVVTAETADEASSMMKELLEDELAFAFHNNNLKNLFSSPASIDLHFQWVQAAIENLKIVPLDVEIKESEHPEIEPKNAHYRSEVQIALAA